MARRQDRDDLVYDAVLEWMIYSQTVIAWSFNLPPHKPIVAKHSGCDVSYDSFPKHVKQLANALSDRLRF